MSNIWAKIGQTYGNKQRREAEVFYEEVPEEEVNDNPEEEQADALEYESGDDIEEGEQDDFADDAFLTLPASSRHQIFDKSSWLRNLVGPEYRDDEGLITLRHQFVATDVGHNKRQVLAIPIQVQIFRMVHDEMLQYRATADGSHQPMMWFEHFFRPQFYPKNNRLEFSFNPLDLNVNLCSILHSLYVPVVRKSVGNRFGDPRAMALYIAHTFLEPELVCKRTMHGTECFGFPYLVDIHIQSTATLDKYAASTKGSKSNLAAWIPSERSQYGVYQSQRAQQTDPKRFRFLIWKAFDNSIWSNPIDVDRDDQPADLAKTLKDTWPMMTEWIVTNLEHIDSFGYDLWKNRHERLIWRCHDHLAPRLCAPCSDQVFYPMANYNNDRLVRIASAAHSLSKKQTSASSSGSRDLDEYALGPDATQPISQWIYHSHTTMDAFSAHPSQWADNNGHTHDQSREERKQDRRATEWMSLLQEFSTKPISIALLAPKIEQALHQAGLDSSVISCGELSTTIVPPFAICAEDAQRHFVPIPPSGHFAIDPTSLIWTSSKCRIVACGMMTTCIEIPWTGLKSKEQDFSNVVILKVLDMASVVDQFCLASANPISPSQREAIVDHAATQFRREIWHMASLPRSKYLVDFYGWTLFGSMLCIVQERLECTLSIFLSYFDALVLMKYRSQKRKTANQDVLSLVLTKCAKHAEIRNKRIWNDASYRADMEAKISWMDETFGLVGSPTATLCRALLKCVVQICHGLAHMHANGIVHRDVKPSNIVMTSSGRCKLIDFGSSTAISQRMLVQVYGTPRFLPLNFAQDNVVRYYAHDDGSVDVYAVLEILKTALKPFADMVDRLVAKVQEASCYLAEQVLVSVVDKSPEMIGIIVPGKNHEPWILAPTHVAHRQRVLQSALTAAQLASIISKAAKRLE